MLDLVIVGGSAAGCTAAIYAARAKLNFKMISENLGGEMTMAGVVGNWPGIKEINGFELAQKLAEHVKSYNVEIEEGWHVEKISQEKNYHILLAKNAKGEEKTYETKTVIVATGIHPRHLKVPGEKEFFHKGVTYCSVCDGPLFKNKTTVTVGAGNAALESAIMMSKIAKKVYLLTKYPNTKEKNNGFPRGEQILVEKVLDTPNIEIVNDAETVEIVGTMKVQGLKYKNSQGQENTLTVDGVMVHVGSVPNSDFVTGVETDPAANIIVDAKGRTNIPGIFAAGDVANLPFKQMIIASGQGAVTALAAVEYINKWKE